MRKGNIDSMVKMLATILFLIIFLIAIGYMKFWNAKKELDSKLMLERLNTDMTFLQSTESGVRVYEEHLPLDISLGSTEITVTPKNCAPEVMEAVGGVASGNVRDLSECDSIAQKHHVLPTEIAPIYLASARAICLIKRPSDGKVTLCDRKKNADCCRI